MRLCRDDDTLTGFDIQTNDAVSPLLDATFAQSAASPSVSLQGSFADATYLSGTYLAAVAGNFQAVGRSERCSNLQIHPHDHTQ